MINRITKKQLEAIILMTDEITDELVSEVKKLEKKYELNLSTCKNDDAKAALFNLGVNRLKADKAHYLYDKYIYLTEEVATHHDFKSHSYEHNQHILTQQKNINIDFNFLIKEYIYKEIADLNIFINNKQILFEVSYNKIKNYLNACFNIGMPITFLIYDMILMPATKRRKYLETLVYKKEDIPANRLKIIEAIITLNEYAQNKSYVNTQKIILETTSGILYISNDDVDQSIIKLNSLFEAIIKN